MNQNSWGWRVKASHPEVHLGWGVHRDPLKRPLPGKRETGQAFSGCGGQKNILKIEVLNAEPVFPKGHLLISWAAGETRGQTQSFQSTKYSLSDPSGIWATNIRGRSLDQAYTPVPLNTFVPILKLCGEGGQIAGLGTPEGQTCVSHSFSGLRKQRFPGCRGKPQRDNS